MTDVNDELREYLGYQKAARDKGFTLESLHKTTQTLFEGQKAHELKCEERWRLNDDKHKSLRVRAEVLEGKVDDLEKQEEDTGSHIIQLNRDVGRVEGKVSGKPASLPPGLRVVNFFVQTVAEKWTTHVATLAVGAAGVYVAHLLHWLR